MSKHRDEVGAHLDACSLSVGSSYVNSHPITLQIGSRPCAVCLSYEGKRSA